MVPQLPALLELGSVKDVWKSFLWQGAAPGAPVRVACGRSVMCASLSGALWSRLAPDCPWSLREGRVCSLEGDTFSWLPLPKSWIWGWSVISKLRLPCCGLAFLLERSHCGPSCCSADWDAGWGGCSKQQVLLGWVSHCGRHCGKRLYGRRIRLISLHFLHVLCSYLGHSQTCCSLQQMWNS